MSALAPGMDGNGPARTHAARMAAEQRVAGRVGGAAMTIGSLVALFTTRLLSPTRVPAAFDFVVAATLCTGIACSFVPWGRLPSWCLHALPLCATLQTAVGIRVGRLDPTLADDYYVLVVAFAAYAFSSRRAVAFQVALAMLASTAPLIYNGSVDSETPARTVVAATLLVVVAGIVTMLREGLQRRQNELEALAMRDPLTGVGNYRLLVERLDYELARHRRSAAPLSVMLLDLDGFKEVNDTFGHLVGDRVLVEVARSLSGTIRAQDTLARQGGDEFSILAPETDHEHTAVLSARIASALAVAMNGSVTTSIGWATFPRDGTDCTALLAHADAHLRRIKNERGVTQRRGERPAPAAAIVGLVEEVSG